MNPLALPSKRRSRMHRQSTGKRIELTKRDYEIFTLLQRYRFLRSTYIHAFVGGNRTKLIERLGDLYHEGGYVDRPSHQWEAANARHQPVIYELAPRGYENLYAMGHVVFHGALSPSQARPHRQFDHTLLACEAVASIELAASHRPGLRFLPWEKILAKAPEAARTSPYPLRIDLPSTEGERIRSIIPDAMFGLEYEEAAGKSFRFFALEVDRATMPVLRSRERQTSYVRKLVGYREVLAGRLYKLHWGLPNLLVLTLTTTERHAQALMSAVRATTDSGVAFLFKTMLPRVLGGRTPLPFESILSSPWQRAGHPDFNIDRP